MSLPTAVGCREMSDCGKFISPAEMPFASNTFLPFVAATNWKRHNDTRSALKAEHCQAACKRQAETLYCSDLRLGSGRTSAERCNAEDTSALDIGITEESPSCAPSYKDQFTINHYPQPNDQTTHLFGLLIH